MNADLALLHVLATTCQNSEYCPCAMIGLCPITNPPKLFEINLLGFIIWHLSQECAYGLVMMMVTWWYANMFVHRQFTDGLILIGLFSCTVCHRTIWCMLCWSAWSHCDKDNDDHDQDNGDDEDELDIMTWWSELQNVKYFTQINSFQMNLPQARALKS